MTCSKNMKLSKRLLQMLISDHITFNHNKYKVKIKTLHSSLFLMDQYRKDTTIIIMYSKIMFLFLHVLKYRSIFPQSDIVNFFV